MALTEFNFADMFEAISDVIPDRESLVCGSRRLTFGELELRANRLAHHLQSVGVGQGDHVGTQLVNGTEYVEALLACLKLRAVPVNVNYRYVEEELAYLYDDADLVALVVHRELASRAAKVRTDKLRHAVVVEDGSGADLGGLDAVMWNDALA